MRVLTITHRPASEGDPARVEVTYRPEPGAAAQRGTTTFEFALGDPVRERIQWYLEEYLLFPWGEFRERAATAEREMEEAGHALFNALFDSRETGRLYAKVADHLDETRIIIDATSPAGIAIPWELLRDPALQYGEIARRAHTFVRSQSDLREASAEFSGDAVTFNILLVICRPGDRDTEVPFQSVARPLLELFRPHRDRIRLDVLRPPTFEQLASLLAEQRGFYHVVHFDGHGAFPQHAGGAPMLLYGDESMQGRLLFEDADGKPDPVSGERLGSVLAGSRVPVVMLNACQSGMSHPESLYPSVASQLLAAGARGVVAMAYSVYVQSAVRFMARLYEGLINGQDLARSVSLGRERLFAEPDRMSPIGKVPLRDWIVPLLFEAAPVQLVPEPESGLRLDPDALDDRQDRAGNEIECPEPPAFGFVGRDNLILDLERALRTETTVLLQGMAGVGKTEAALGFGRWLAETGGLAGPIFFFQFEHHLPVEGVIDRVGQVFGPAIKRELGQEFHLLDSNGRRRVAVDVLRQVPCLMIWDNFEPVAGFPSGTPSEWTDSEQEVLREFLRDVRGGATKVLITSRRDEPWLGNVYRRVPLGGLNLRESQELAIAILERAGMSAAEVKGLPAYNELLHFLRGNPLAIQVILPELARETPEHLLDQLQRGEADLSADDPTLRRDRSLAASLNYRLDRLDDPTRHRLAVLGLFTGFVNAATLEHFSGSRECPEPYRGLSVTQWVGVLDQAAELGLLSKLGNYVYRLHPAIAWSLRAVLEDVIGTDLTPTYTALANSYAVGGRHIHATLFASDPELAMRLLSEDERNLMRALTHSIRLESWKAASDILYAVGRLMTVQGRWHEWEQLLFRMDNAITSIGADRDIALGELELSILGHQEQLAAHRHDTEKQESILLELRGEFERSGDDRNLAAVTHQLGRVAEQRLDFETAERLFQESLSMERKLGNRHGEATSLHQLGILAHHLRQYDKAASYYQRSLVFTEEIGAEHDRARTLHQFAVLAADRGRDVDAEVMSKESLSIMDRIGDPAGQVASLQMLGIVAYRRAQHGEAEQLFKQSLAISDSIGDYRNKAVTLCHLGDIAMRRRQFEEAAGWFRRSLKIEDHLGDDYRRVQVLDSLGTVAEERGLFDEAEQCHQQSLVIKERLGDDHAKGITLHQLGFVAQQRRLFDKAERWYEQGLAVAERIGDGQGKAKSQFQLGRVAEERQLFDEAERLYQRSLAAWESIDDNHGTSVALYQLGVCSKKRKSLDEAERWYRMSMSVSERIGDNHGKARTLHQLGTVAEERRQFDEAKRLYNESLTVSESAGDDLGRAVTLHQLGRVAEEQYQFDEAVSLYRQAEEHCIRLGDARGLKKVRRSLERLRDDSDGPNA